MALRYKSNVLVLNLLAAGVVAMMPLDFDLAKSKPATPDCSSQTTRPNETVVCARRGQSQKVVGSEDTPPLLPKAEIKLFGKVKGSLTGERAGVGGFVSNRIMATVKVPF